MKFLYFCFIATLVILQGCSTTEATPQSNHSQIETTDTTSNLNSKPASDTPVTENNTEELNNEFEDEFSETTTEVNDPLSGYNRAMTTFNDNFFTYALNPVSKAYAAVIPQPVRIGVSNFVHNLNFPIRLVNNLLQLKFMNISDELERFIVNSTVGVAGLMDPATHYMNIPKHNEDFGQTLGHYGAGPGFHLVLPLIGPSNARDAIGLVPDIFLSPLINLHTSPGESIAIYGAVIINKNSLRLGEYESLKKDALDLYPFLKNIYEQKRVSDIAE